MTANDPQLFSKIVRYIKIMMFAKKKITRRTTGVKRNNFITRVFEIYFNLRTNH